MSLQAEIVVDGKNELGEGVVWSSAHGEVQWTDILGRRFWTYSPSDGAARSVALPDRLACFAPLGGTSLLAGFAGGLEVFDLKSGARRPIAAIEPDRPTTRVNDGKLDRRGRLVFGTMDEDPSGARPIGQVYAYEGGTSPRALVSGVRIANSIAFSPDGRRMYFADTPTKVIRCYDYDLDSGDLCGERTFAARRRPRAPGRIDRRRGRLPVERRMGRGPRRALYARRARRSRRRLAVLAGHLLRVRRRQARPAFRHHGADRPRRGGARRSSRTRARCSSSTPASPASPIPRFPPRVRRSRFERSASRSSAAAVLAVAACRHLRL